MKWKIKEKEVYIGEEGYVRRLEQLMAFSDH